MTPTPLPVTRAYLRNVQPQFHLPQRLSNTVVMVNTSQAPRLPGLADKETLNAVDAVLDVHGVEERFGIVHAFAAVTGVRFASDCGVRIQGFGMADGSPIRSYEEEKIVWGHYRSDLDEDVIRFVMSHFDVILRYSQPETYSRVANAMRLYGNALRADNSDLALLGFVGALESLFSIAPQELSFRLSLLLSKFLGHDADSRRDFFRRCRDLYVVRSKIAHGDKIDDREEAAAIEIAETWTPEAEGLARASLRAVLEEQLTAVFDSRKQHESLLTELLFESNLGAAIARVAP